MCKLKWKRNILSAKDLRFGFLPRWWIPLTGILGFVARTKTFWCFDLEEIWNINDNTGIMGKSGLWVNSACTSLLSQAWVPPVLLQRIVPLPPWSWFHKRLGRQQFPARKTRLFSQSRISFLLGKFYLSYDKRSWWNNLEDLSKNKRNTLDRNLTHLRVL